MYSYSVIQQIIKIRLACQDGVTEVNDTKSREKNCLRCMPISFHRNRSTFWN